MSGPPELTPDDLTRPEPPSPPATDQFRNERGKISPTALARHVLPNLARGPDGTFYEYRAGVWERDADALTRRVAAALGDEYSATVDGQVKAHLLTLNMPEIDVRQVDSVLPYVVVENGVYDWRDDEFRHHHPDFRALTKLPIVRDPAATAPRFREWLNVVFAGVPEMVPLVYELIGYCLMTGNPFQKAILLYGEGRNGKGTFLRVLGKLLGEANYSSLSLHTLVEDRFSAAALFGKLANLSGDLSDRFVKQPEIVKQITGGDAITASHKYGQPFTFVPYAVPVFAANALFRSSDSSHGWRRRWLVVEFPNQFHEGNFDEATLYDEAPGILNDAMSALRTLMHRGRFDPPAPAVAATERLHNEGDPLLMWLDEDTAVEVEPGYEAPCGEVYQAYRGWCHQHGHNPLAYNEFGKRLSARGFRKRRSGSGSRTYHYTGLRLSAYG